jgi:hypothetical protein
MLFIRFSYQGEEYDELLLRHFQHNYIFLSTEYRDLLPCGKTAGRLADHCPSSSAEVKNGGAVPFLPHTWRDAYLIKRRDNFVFTFL